MLIATLRTVLGFLLALTATRLLNKQFVARLTYFDFTLGVVIGSLAGHIPDDYSEPLLPVVVPLVVVTLLGIVTGWVALRFEGVRHLMQGEPTVLIQNGKLLDENMGRLRYNLDQLNSQLRVSGIFDIETVEFAVLEPGGQLSVRVKSQGRPVTPADLHLSTVYEGMALELIMDGQVIAKNLRENGLSRAWLEERLRERGVADPSEVFYAVLNTRGQLFIDLVADQINRPVDLETVNPSTPPSPKLLP
jgi:uncharacterized membrane protein YcaP (DUF421 family)